MKLKSLIVFVLLVSTLLADDFPSAPFTFVGITQKVESGTFRTPDGEMKSILVLVVEVKKGRYRDKEIHFVFPANQDVPLLIGRRYLFTAVWDRHGIRFTEWDILKNNAP